MPDEEATPESSPPTLDRPAPTGTVTFFFTDVEGSTRLWEEHREEMPAAIARHDAVLRREVLAHGGHVVKATGDGLHAAFARATDAVGAAVACQRALAAEDGGAVPRLAVRIGLHSGVAEERDGDYFGPAVNRAQRLMGAAHGGQVLLSQATAALVAGVLPEGVVLRDLGTHRLRDLPEPEHLFQVTAPGLLDAFPPVRSHGVGRHNLPAQLSSFVGREAEIADLHSLLTTSRLVTLTGAGGSGKTRLALEVAAGALDRFSDGVWFVELAPLTDPELVAPAVAAALGVREEPGRTLADGLLEHVGRRRLLLVLDNCEHLVAACAGLAQRLLAAGPGARVLATSREALGVAGEVVWPVPGLSLPDAGRPASAEELGRAEAVRLFVERAAAVRPGFALNEENGVVVAHLCRRLDGLPLAIELAAARVKALAPEQIAARLDQRFRLLTGGSRTALPRQQTLRAAVEWSYELLEAPERALLARLSVFAGGWALEAAEAVCAGDGLLAEDVLDLLLRLVDKSLVIAEEQAGAARYRLLETIREYALERLADGGPGETLRRRYAGYYLASAEAAMPGLADRPGADALARLDREYENLLAALGWALGRGETETALRLGAALWRFWEVHGHLAEGRRWLEAALSREGGAPAPRAKAYNAAGTLAWHQGAYAEAAAHHERALALYERLDDREGAALALMSLGTQALYLGDQARARALYDRSLSLAREAGAKRIVAMMFHNLAELAAYAGDYERMAALCEEALVLERELGEKALLSVTLETLAFCERVRGRYERAATLLAESLALAQDVGDTFLIVNSLEGVVGVAAARSDPASAARLCGAAEALREAMGAPPSPLQREYLDRTMAAARAALGEEAVAAARAEGRTMTVEQAIADASAVAAACAGEPSGTTPRSVSGGPV